MEIGKAIRAIRKKKGIKQGALVSSTGLTQTALSQIESGKYHPNTKNLDKICKALGVKKGVVFLYAIEYTEIPTQNKEQFDELFPPIRNLIEALING